MLVVGAAEPEIQSWLRAAGHAPRAVRRADAAGPALEEEPVDLVIVDRDSSGLDAPAVCRVLRDDARLGDAWLLAITVAAKGRMADSVLDAGADDYLHRPFTRAELIARARAGLRAAEQRGNDRLLRTLMENVPGAIYRSGWHSDFMLEMISDEIERISGYPPAGFLASSKRTILSIVHPDDVDEVLEGVARSSEHHEPFVLEYRIVRADGEVRWVLDRGQPVTGPGRAAVGGRRDLRHHGAARGRGGAAARTRSRPPARPNCALRGRASSRPPTTRGARSSATSTTARSSGSSASSSTSRSLAGACRGPGRRRPVPRAPGGASSRRPRPSCASWRGASTRPC